MVVHSAGKPMLSGLAMNEGVRVVTVHLLAQMRATTLVQAAYARLGVDREKADGLLRRAEALTLHRPGHSMNVYRELLGDPVSEQRVGHSDPCARLRWTYSLPSWPELLLVVHGSEAGQTGELAFGRRRDSAALQDPTDLRPWAIVEDDLCVLEGVRRVHEWYPQRDYEVDIGGVGGDATARTVLQFDFGLLQTALAP